MTTTTRFRIATSAAPGAVAIIELVGDVQPTLRKLTGRGEWPIGHVGLRSLADVDEGLAVRLSEDLCWIMPHGGPRVIQRLAQWLAANGVQPVRDLEPWLAFPEAASRLEALALAAVSRAASPLAVDLLLDQPRRWCEHQADSRESLDSIRRRSRILDRLITPPLVVLVGRPNVGKSTLTNTLLGREGSITSEQEGTTRDYLVSRLDLGGLVVHWCDTPGRRVATDPIEREAIRLASQLVGQADLVVAAAAPGIEWPELERDAELRGRLKADLLDSETLSGDCDGLLRVSAKHGTGLDTLVRSIRDLLIAPGVLAHDGPWLFDERIVTG